MTSIRKPTSEAIVDAARALDGGKLVGVPTETVYGLAANALDAIAVGGIFAAKGRPATNPLIVHIADIASLSRVVSWPIASAINARLKKIIDLWPGPLTVVLPRGPAVPDVVTAGRSNVAVRVPKHPVMQALLEQAGVPLAAPSANRSQYVSPTTAQHVADGLGDELSMILDGGRCDVGLESTIVDLCDVPRLLRPGVITVETLADRFGLPIDVLTRSSDSTDVLEAPGMMPVHYSPTTPIQFVCDSESIPQGRVGRIAFRSLDASESSQYAVVEVVSEKCDLKEVSQNLFGSMRKLDQMSLDEIVIDTCSDEGIGRAIMDRLKRAAAR